MEPCDRLGHMAAKNDFTGSDETDALFQLPLAEFTAGRNALAARLKKAGKADAAAYVKALQKPSISAWAVNQLHWRYPREFAKLLAAGDAFRDAQKAQLAGKKADIRGTLEARREALTEMTARAGDVLKAAGHAATPDLMRRIATTLETLATYGSLSNRSTGPGTDGQAAGRLVDDIEPAGFEALATLIPMGENNGPSGAPSRVIPFKQRAKHKRPPKPKNAEEEKRQHEAEEAAKREAARKALQEAEKTLRAAKHEAQQAEAALKKAAPRAKEAERIRAAAEKAFEKATREADEITKEARRVARLAEEAAQALSDAEAELVRLRADPHLS
jgi:hypothetical protein